MVDSANSTQFPGWYADPQRIGAERFWDGRQWTDNIRGTFTEPPAPTHRAQPDPDVVVDLTSQHGTAPSIDVAAPQTPAPVTPAPTPTTSQPLVASPTSAEPAKPVARSEQQTQRQRLAEPLQPSESVRAETPPAVVAKADAVAKTAAITPPATATSPQEDVSSSIVTQPEAAIPVKSVITSTFAETAKPLAEAKPIDAAKPVVAAKPAAALKPTDVEKPVEPAVAPKPVARVEPAVAKSPTTPVTPAAMMAPSDPGADATKRRRWWVVAALAGLCLGLAGFLIGFAVNEGDSIASTDVAPAATEVQGSTSTESAPTPDAALVEDLETAEARVGELESAEQALVSDLESATAAADVAEAERDNLAEHNELLRSWFTADVLNQSQRSWDAEVARACALSETPTIDDVIYGRRLEVVGTNADLLAAVLDCRAAG